MLHTPEQIVNKLREADTVIASGGAIEQACKQLGISDATCHNRRSRYGQMKLYQVKQLKSLQKENVVRKNETNLFLIWETVSTPVVIIPPLPPFLVLAVPPPVRYY